MVSAASDAREMESARDAGEASPRAKALSGRSARALVVALVIILSQLPLIAWAAAKNLVVSAELERADAIVVLSGSAAYLERTQLAAQLFREGRAARIVLTNDGIQGGWSQAEERNPFFIERAAMDLQSAGVPSANIESLAPVMRSTYEEARLLREYTQARGLRSLLVVTSGYHTRRALWIFRRVFEGSGVHVGIAPVAPGAETPAPATWWFHADGWRWVAGEYVKIVIYRFRYR